MWVAMPIYEADAAFISVFPTDGLLNFVFRENVSALAVRLGQSASDYAAKLRVHHRDMSPHAR